MFGYVRVDTPYLFIKDQTLYEAMYCGVCKGIGEVCGHAARMGLTYDIAFLSVILHNLAEQDVVIEKQHCLTHCIRTKQMANVDELTRQLGALNTMMVYYKYTDDIQDGEHGKGKRFWFAKGFHRARKKYPEIERIVRESILAQSEIEKQKIGSLDRASDASATMLAKVSDYLLGNKATADTYGLFYAIGKWVYLIDALDDYDKDKKKGAYNPFRLAYQAECRADLLRGQSGEEVQYAFHSLFFDIRQNLSKLQFKFNRDLSDNILLRGLPMMTKRIMEGKGCDCKRDKTPQITDNIGK